MIIDTHTHFLTSSGEFDNDREEVINRAVANGIKKFVEVSYDEEISLRAVDFVKNRPNFVCSIGIHPHDASKLTLKTISKLKELALANPKKVSAIGEIGLDYFRNLSPKDVQLDAFKLQLELAISLNKPVIIHCRDAKDDMKKTLAKYTGLKGSIHSFSGEIKDAEFYINKGFVLGISGPLTYKNNYRLKEVIKNIDLKNIILETDCPYLPPVPHRGERNEPSYLKYIASEIATLKQLDQKIIEDITTENAEKLFFS
jgi:TatD DNase family protein